MSTTPTTTVAPLSISRHAAARLITAAREAATEQGLPLAIAVTDASGHLRAFEAMDDAPFLAHTVAIDKAWTAAAYRLPTHVWAHLIQDPPLAQLAHLPRLIAVGGGFPIVSEGTTIGGLGLSGGAADQDAAVAETALTQLGFAAAA
jgi:uncharacterized protein GlcG (DUF336 family)